MKIVTSYTITLILNKYFMFLSFNSNVIKCIIIIPNSTNITKFLFKNISIVISIKKVISDITIDLMVISSSKLISKISFFNFSFFANFIKLSKSTKNEFIEKIKIINSILFIHITVVFMLSYILLLSKILK